MAEFSGSRSPKSLGDAQWEKISALFREEGLSAKQLAERFGVSSKSVRRHLVKRFGSSGVGKPGRPVTP